MYAKREMKMEPMIYETWRRAEKLIWRVVETLAENSFNGEAQIALKEVELV